MTRARVRSVDMGDAAAAIAVKTARTLLLTGLGLMEDPARPSGSDRVLAEIERLGFVQIDSINTVERAHHHILWTRLHSYAPRTLDALQRAGSIFEHWTHDASFIPARWFPHWRHRFAKVAWGPWLRRRLGRNHREVLDGVLGRIRREGPLRARDFERTGRGGGTWWNWKPAKAALEYLWRTGQLAIPHRVRFEKVYDLTERVLPDLHGLAAPSLEEHVEWACRSAMERLGVATPRELSGFWGLVTIGQAAAWCAAAVKRGEIVGAQVGRTGPSRQSFALADWRARAAAVGAAPAAMRILSPFDPLIRDRARCLRLFDFDYRFEAFVPAPKRRHGYYVLPVLEGDRLVARLDPDLDRGARVLHVRRVWWEQGVRTTRARKSSLEDALARYGLLIGAGRIEVGPRN